MKINIVQLILLIVVFFTLPILALIANLNKKINKLTKSDENYIEHYSSKLENNLENFNDFENDDINEDNNSMNDITINQNEMNNINIIEQNYNNDINNNIVNKFNNIFKEFDNLNNENINDDVLFPDINYFDKFNDNYNNFNNEINDLNSDIENILIIDSEKSNKKNKKKHKQKKNKSKSKTKKLKDKDNNKDFKKDDIKKNDTKKDEGKKVDSNKDDTKKDDTKKNDIKKEEKVDTKKNDTKKNEIKKEENNKINSQLNNLKVKDKLLKKDISSETLLSVSKVVSKHWDKNGIDVYKNEKKWLNILKKSDVIARPIHFNDETRTITTEYAGEKINKDNLPQDWEKQRDYIISELEKYNCRHNDIKPEEILVDKGKIRIIDFGWAYEKNKDNPKSWPDCLGNDFKYDKNVFNDKESFNKSISYIKAL